MASYTAEKAFSLAGQTISRLKAIHSLLKQSSSDEDNLFEFLSASNRAEELYQQFQLVSQQTLVDESSTVWKGLCDSIVEIDLLYFKIDAIGMACKKQVKSQKQFETVDNSYRSNESLHSKLSSKKSNESLDNKYHSKKSNLRLPKINLLLFDGALKEWSTYYDLFKTLVHDNESLDNIEKFQYLISTLSKEPLTLVKHLPITSNNYLIAFDTLIDRYQNERVLATHYWQSINSLPKLNCDSSQALRDLLNTFNENHAALNQFPNVDLWDFTMFNWLLGKLDSVTRKRFEMEFSKVDFPSYEDLRTFLTGHCRALETSSLNNPLPLPTNKSSNPKGQSKMQSNKYQSLVASTSNNSSKQACANCKGEHRIFKCSSFLDMSPFDRYKVVKSNNLCQNCLGFSHTAKQCSSTSTCRHCSSRHNSLLHFPKVKASTTTTTDSSSASQNPDESLSPPVAMSSLSSSVKPIKSQSTVLLATIRLEIQDKWGNHQIVRALCDSGSQSSFLTESCRKRLGLSINRSSLPISCLGQVTLNSSCGTTMCKIRPVGSSQHTFQVNALVLPSICGRLPNAPLSPSKSVENLKLADPSWHMPSHVDMLLGADVFSNIVRGGFLPGDGNSPAAFNTVFGWILLGTISSITSDSIHSYFMSLEPGFDDMIKAFWTVEEVPVGKVSSPEDKQAETMFVNSHFRDHSGRFGIALPFKDNQSLPAFSGSLEIADRRLLALERRLSNQPKIRDMYVAFMQDYLSSQHMSLLPSLPAHNKCYFIPHHCVFKEEGGASKIRVVFDASAKTSDGLSLNGTLLVGPKLQSDIATILLKFRQHKFVFTCDIRQMYRQILVTEPHRQYQLIRWRFFPDKPIETYQLNTVTYGVASSPYLAIRCLVQLAREHLAQFPLASQAIQSDLYVDDIASGSDDIQSTLELRDQLIQLLKLGQFELRKWSANHPSLISDLPSDHCQERVSSFDSDLDFSVKILGLLWQSVTDSFSFSVKSVESPCTKRTILSEVAKIYDPLGFLSPLTFFAKRLIQHLWSLGLDWDSEPPEDVCAQWNRYKTSLHLISELNIPRHLKPVSNYTSCELHAFCDSSELGYACVVYLRFQSSDNIHVSFVMAKSKVAPLKRLSIPRLELCAAVLLSNLVEFIVGIEFKSLVINRIFAWSDSTVTLSWIRSSPHRWKTFVANRVTHIQDRVSPSCWHHVPSGENPADIASRGLLPPDLLICSSWWAGPDFLKLPPDCWPTECMPQQSTASIDCEAKRIVLLNETVVSDVDHLLTRFSSLRKIQGVVAYCFRFINNCRHSRELAGSLTRGELHHALLYIVKTVQSRVFGPDIAKIQSGQPCPKYLQKLSPFLDESGVLRVGGRLYHSGLSFETKHPALLPRNHRLTELLILQIHSQHLHPGVNTTLYLLQENFWILSGRRAIRQYLSKCYKCFRTRPSAFTPTMGDLPPHRVSQLKPFSCVGVDYGGPFSILVSRRRNAKITKAYLCLFVCCATRAVHLEVACDLSTEAFLAALRRFVARRGRCSHIYSDNGTNFIGASKELTSYMQLSAETEGIEWHFNPPSAPHFGGLWESGIKSVKTHMTRVIGNQRLTYEEFNTFIIQVEALLNSRPLCSLSTDPKDLRVLTPGHFLTLEPLTAAPDSDLSHLKLSRLSRWQLVQRLHQDFWKRWKNEYLHNFYQRDKWSKTRVFEPTDVGRLVLIKDDLAPPLRWKLGRIVELYRGADGIARVASVRTIKGCYKRPLVKLCPLPLQ